MGRIVELAHLGVGQRPIEHGKTGEPASSRFAKHRADGLAGAHGVFPVLDFFNASAHNWKYECQAF